MGGAASVDNLPTCKNFAEVIIQYHEGARQGKDNYEIFEDIKVGSRERVGSLEPSARELQLSIANMRHKSTCVQIERLYIPNVDDKAQRALLQLAVRQSAACKKNRAKSLSDNFKLKTPSNVTMQNAPDYETIKKHLRRAQIFEKGLQVDDATKNVKKKRDHKIITQMEISDDAKATVLYALKDFFFMGIELFENTNIIFEAMELEVVKEGQYLMRQDETGTKMYVIEHGVFDIEVDGIWIAEVSDGERVGDLALVYNTPRSASVRCRSQTAAVWSLSRNAFREIQALSSSAAFVQRNIWLHAVQKLKSLDRFSLSKLAQSLQFETLNAGDIVLLEGEATQKCILIEHGKCKAECNEKPKTIAELMCIEVYSAKSKGTNGKTGLGRAPSPNRRTSKFKKDMQKNTEEMLSTIEANSTSERPSIVQRQILLNACQVDGHNLVFQKGCFLGVPIILAAAGMDGGWGWMESDRPELEGAICPFTIKALTPMRIAYFTVQGFEDLIGPLDAVLGDNSDGFSPNKLWRGDTMDQNSPREKQNLFLGIRLEELQNIMFLGKGSFGSVTLVKKQTEPLEGELFALKSLEKSGMIEHDQVTHVIDEKKMLTLCNHPFILRLYATFQDHDTIYLLTEIMQGGELWALIYDGVSGWNEGLPRAHVVFYAANVVEALDHIHKKGIAYRDLKPENLMLDARGYLRVIDFGFAKQIPYKATVNGVLQVQLKSYTLCGTPEYLAPEFIYNTGHDHTCDLWALGVLIFELIASHTPFAKPGGKSDMTEVFTKIALCKRAGIPYPEDFDKKAGTRHAKDLINKLMHHEPPLRLGNLARRMIDVKGHPYFQGTRWQDLLSFHTEAPWIPPALEIKETSEARPSSQPYLGDQSLFEIF